MSSVVKRGGSVHPRDAALRRAENPGSPRPDVAFSVQQAGLPHLMGKHSLVLPKPAFTTTHNTSYLFPCYVGY